MDRVLEPEQNYGMLSIEQMSNTLQHTKAQYERDMAWITDIANSIKTMQPGLTTTRAS